MHVLNAVWVHHVEMKWFSINLQELQKKKSPRNHNNNFKDNYLKLLYQAKQTDHAHTFEVEASAVADRFASFLLFYKSLIIVLGTPGCMLNQQGFLQANRSPVGQRRM